MQFKLTLRFDKAFFSEEFRLASFQGGRGGEVHTEFCSLEAFCFGCMGMVLSFTN